MTTQERIYKKLNLHRESVELSAERIELSIASDIKKAIKALIKQEKEMDKAKDEMEKAINLLSKAKKESKNTFDKYKIGISGQLSINPYTVIKEAKALAKELGVNVTAIKDFNALESDAEFNDDLKRKVEEIRDELQKLVK